MQQVDDGRDFVEVGAGGKGRCHILEHAQTIVTATSEDFHILETIIIIVGKVDEYVAMVLRLIILTIARITRTGTEYTGYAIAVVAHRAQVDKGTLLSGHLTADTIEGRVCIVIISIRATEDGVHTTLEIFYIRRSLQQVVVLTLSIAVQLFLHGGIILYTGSGIKAVLIITLNLTAKVVTAIHNIPYPWET